MTQTFNYQLTRDLTLVDLVTGTEMWTGVEETLKKGTRFNMILQKHKGHDFPQHEYYVILVEGGLMYLPLANQLEGAYEEI